MSYSFPEVPSHPPGYFGIKEKQREFLNIVKPNLYNVSKKRKIPSNILNEANYYAKSLGNKSVSNTIYLEKMRRDTPPFRIPESNRPDMPREAGIPTSDLINLLLGKIWSPFTKEVDRQSAYHKFLDVFLTDWVNRKGFVKNDVQMYYKPFFDDSDFLTAVQENIKRYLMISEEKPNPKTINHRPGNSTRQQLLKRLYERISKRKTNLLQERFNKLVESEGGKRRTRKHRYSKRRDTRRR